MDKKENTQHYNNIKLFVKTFRLRFKQIFEARDGHILKEFLMRQ